MKNTILVKQMEIKLNIPEYSTEQGLRSIWEDGFEIETEIIDNEIVIKANRAGLISLAKQLLTLAHDNVPSSCHFHLDEHSGLETGSKNLIIEKS
ncbi:hypothetical protein VRU48_02465 [Pedobacter sp. KR3-3]|uniref:Uncharacterized protein n=1 Tax=Pedobacter albus TaxID=3113905 RepID=A0ABU7I3I1_9SPHI|nr:hypothetical protein [Pedobacter sp. KR3-3]MEE1943954.1 hypothetical protein [Pedobacter sp. KR3-3]